MKLFQVAPADIGRAWDTSAHQLSKAAEKCDDMTSGELLARLLDGRYTLIGAGDGVDPLAWAAVSVQKHWLFVHAIYAPGATGMDVFEQLKRYAAHNGCKTIRGSCCEAVRRLWVRRFDALPVSTVMEIEL